MNKLLKEKQYLEKQKSIKKKSIKKNTLDPVINKLNPNKKNSQQINSSKNQFDIESIISEELINQFIEKIKEIDDLLIIKTNKNIYNLKPI